MKIGNKTVYVQVIKVYSTSKGDLCEVKHEIESVNGVVVEYGEPKVVTNKLTSDSIKDILVHDSI